MDLGNVFIFLYPVVDILDQTDLSTLLFADDCALNASFEEVIQRSMGKLSLACDAFGYTINIKKTEVLYQPAPNTN